MEEERERGGSETGCVTHKTPPSDEKLEKKHGLIDKSLLQMTTRKGGRKLRDWWGENNEILEDRDL